MRARTEKDLIILGSDHVSICKFETQATMHFFGAVSQGVVKIITETRKEIGKSTQDPSNCHTSG